MGKPLLSACMVGGRSWGRPAPDSAPRYRRFKVSLAAAAPLANDKADDEAEDGAEREPEDEDPFCGLLEHGCGILVETEAGPVSKSFASSSSPRAQARVGGLRA
jgi:hypothetical protein